jgi:hypothetical protein
MILSLQQVSMARTHSLLFGEYLSTKQPHHRSTHVFRRYNVIELALLVDLMDGNISNLISLLHVVFWRKTSGIPLPVVSLRSLRLTAIAVHSTTSVY